MKTKFFLILLCLLAGRLSATGIGIIAPKDNFTCPTFTQNFSWNPALGFTQYRLKCSTTPDMSAVFKDTLITGTSATIRFSPVSTTVYWQVVTANAKGYLSSAVRQISFINPSQDPNILIWLAADSNLVVQPDSTVSDWNNIVPNGLNAIQANASSRPTLKVNQTGLAGQATLRFDGNDLFKISTGGLVGNAFIVANYTGGSPFPDFNAILTHQAITSFDDYYFIARGSSTQLENSYFKFNNYVNNILGSELSPLARYKVISGRRPGSLNTAPNFTIAAEGGGGRFWTGDISEIILTKSVAPSESDSLHAYLFSKYSPPVNLGPDIIAGTSFSDPIILSVPDRFLTYLWSTGSGSNSTSVLTGGRYTLKTKDVFGIDSEDDIEVYPYRRLGNKSVYLCSGDSLTVNLGIGAPFTFLWSTGSTANSIVIKTEGQYTVRITDNKSQAIFDTLNVFIDNPVLSPNPTGNSLSICQGEKLFAITQTAYDSLRWSTGSTANFITVTTSGPYSVYGRTTAGCILDKSFNVTIAGQAPAADFTTSVACEKAATVFSDVSALPPGSNVAAWKWTFGDGGNSTEESPQNVYSTIGTYQASLKVTTNFGCSDSIVKTVTVRRNPDANFFNLLSCSGNATTFVDNSTANADSLQAWNWNFAGFGTSTLKNPSFTFPTAGTYNTLLRVTNSFGCSDTLTGQTVVNVSPVANFKADSACAGTNTIFTNLSTVASPNQITSYLWVYGDETQSIQVSQPHLYPTYGEYNVRLSIRASNQCVDTVEKPVRVFANPSVDFTLSNTQCEGKDIQFTDVSTTPDGSALSAWQWFFSGQGTSTEQNPRFAFDEQGNYTIQLTARTAAGCSGSKFRSIAVTSPPEIDFSFTPNNGLPPLSVTFTNNSPTNSNYIWDYGDGSPTFLGYTAPAHVYTVLGSYPIKLLATDFKGCSDSLVKTILVDQAFIDGVMVTVNVVPDGNFYKVVVTVLNNSNIEITTLGITIRLANGSEVREVWTGSLQPGNTVIYPFTGELRYNAAGDIPVICATIESININAVETDVSNNTTCEELGVGPFGVLSLYPNPSTDNVNVGVMLPEDGPVEILVYDVLGRLQFAKKFAGVSGYNNLSIPVQQLNAAVYIVEVEFDGQLLRRQFLRGNRGQ